MYHAEGKPHVSSIWTGSNWRKCSFLHPPPCSEEWAAIARNKENSIYHDELYEWRSSLDVGDLQPVMQPKTKGSGIMVSDLVD